MIITSKMRAAAREMIAKQIALWDASTELERLLKEECDSGADCVKDAAANFDTGYDMSDRAADELIRDLFPRVKFKKTPREWVMHAVDLSSETKIARFWHFGTRQYCERHELYKPIVQVKLVEHPKGDYYGWLSTGATTPTHIWGSRTLFETYFTKSIKTAVKKGEGQVIRLKVKKHIWRVSPTKTSSES